MSIDLLLTASALLASSALGIFVLWRDRRSLVHRIFSLGMLAQALEQACHIGMLESVGAAAVQFWLRAGLVAAALAAGAWLLFSAALGRADEQLAWKRWRWIALAAFLAPALTVLLMDESFIRAVMPRTPFGWLTPLGWAGQAHQALLLLVATWAVSNLERTLRSSVGRARWQVKFMVMGVAALLASRIYTASHAMLFSMLDTQVELVTSAALMLCTIPILVSLRRAGLLQLDIYVSQGLIYRSITLAAVGIYLITVALLVGAVDYLQVNRYVRLDALLVLAALLTLAAVLLSDRLRQGVRAFLSRHFRRPLYDYRHFWRTFTQRSASVVGNKELCRVVVRMVSEAFETLSVTIWLVEEDERTLELGASTALTESEAGSLLSAHPASRLLIKGLREQESIVDSQTASGGWIGQLEEECPRFFKQAHIRHLIPLSAQGELLGILTLQDRVRGKALSVEDFDLLRVIADQAAASLLNLKLSARLQRAKELEVFQNMSAFFAHDLKNLASRLTLTAQNLPRLFDNPEFRQDACQVMSQSVEKIRTFCSRLSTLERKIAVERQQGDLNKLLQATVEELKGSIGASLVESLDPLPPALLDREQIQTVLVNLILNANEATGGEGQIRIRTRRRNGTAELAVSDNGCGMSKEFMQTRLFRPFQSTKKDGMGIGLYQSKLIVEAHQGRMEVESEEGKGSTFRVILPLEA